MDTLTEDITESDRVKTLTGTFLVDGWVCYNKAGVCQRALKFAGAGSLIPITRFANSIVSPAMEYKSEGYLMGVGAKMFTVAGPVLVYGISTGILVGLIYILFNTQSLVLI